MQVKMVTNYAGPLGAADAGKVLDVPEDYAFDLIEAGAATALPGSPSTRPIKQAAVRRPAKAAAAPVTETDAEPAASEPAAAEPDTADQAASAPAE
jgi:hypothetical protein